MDAGIFSLGSALIGAIGAHQTNKASITAASDLNEKNRKWQHNEAALARKASATEAATDRKFQTNQAATARAWSEKMVSNERAYETQMANTAHQREMIDLQAAGLNPILAANSGASIPSVNVPSSPMPSGAMAAQPGAGAPSGSSNMPQLRNVLGDFVHSALEGKHLENDTKRAEIELINAETNRMNARTKRYETSVEAVYKKQLGSKVDAEIKKIKADENWSNWKAKNEEEQVKLVKEKILEVRANIANDTRRTAAVEKQAGAIAYQAVKNADTEAKYKDILGQVQSTKSAMDKKELMMKAEEFKIRLYEGRNKVERELYNSMPGKAIYVLDEVIKAVSPIKFIN